MIKAVFFDIDNTLYNYDRAHEISINELLKYGEAEFSLDSVSMRALLDRAQSRIEDRLGMNSSAIHNRLIRYQCFLELLDYPSFEKAMEMNDIYWNAFLKNMQPEAGIFRLLDELQAYHVRLGIGSDQNSYVQYQKLQILGLLKYFSAIVTSEEAGAEKPSPEFFRLCVDKAQCSAGECIFIGDNIRKDVKGALKNGLHGVWYEPGVHEKGEKGNSDTDVEEDSIIYSYEECVMPDGIRLGQKYCYNSWPNRKRLFHKL